MNRKTLFLILLISLISVTSGCFSREAETFQKLNQILESGNSALRVKQYDKAIEFYDDGLRISPQELAFLNNKSTALRLRGADLYNKSILLENQKAKTDGISVAKKTFPMLISLRPNRSKH